MNGAAGGAHLRLVAKLDPGKARGDATAPGAILNLDATGGVSNMTSFVFDAAILDLATGLNFAKDSFGVLLTKGYRPDRAAHRQVSDVSGEIAGKGYEARAVEVSAQQMPDGVVEVSLGGSLWSHASIDADAAVYFRVSDGALVAHIDLGEVASTNGTFVLQRSRLVMRERRAA